MKNREQKILYDSFFSNYVRLAKAGRERAGFRDFVQAKDGHKCYGYRHQIPATRQAAASVQQQRTNLRLSARYQPATWTPHNTRKKISTSHKAAPPRQMLLAMP